MDVGVRELKQHLSEYLDRAAAGEVIRVTDRGRAKAVIGPVANDNGRLLLGVEEGWVRPPRRSAGLGPASPVRSPERIAHALSEDRDE